MSQTGLLERLSWDSVYFNNLMLPHWYTIETPDFHGQVYRPLIDPQVKLLIVVMPRGFGKTTILQGFLTQQVVNRRHPVIVYISDTYTQAEMHTETVRSELEANEKIARLYGNQVGNKWTSSIWTTSNGVTVVPKGSNQSIRGLKIGQHRPSLVIIDDPENDENTDTEEQRDKLWRHIYAVVKPMMQAGRADTKIAYIGTTIHEDCVLLRLIDLVSKSPYNKDKSIKVVRLSARDEEGHSIWPALWSDERLDAEEAFYAAAGQIDVFYREYLSQVISTKDATFPIGTESYYTNDELPDDLRTYGAIDIAFKEGRGNDFCAIVVVSVSSKTGCAYVREAIRKRLKPDKFLKVLSEINSIYSPQRWFVQNVTLDEFFKFYASEKDFRLPFEGVTISRQANAKVRRISSLSPLYYMQRLKFQHRQSDLLSELFMFPRSKHDDLSDSLATLIQNVYIPAWTPDVVQEVVPGTLEYIQDILERRRNKRRYGLSYVPGMLKGVKYAA